MMMGMMFWFILLGAGCGVMMLVLFEQTSHTLDIQQGQKKRKGLTKSAFEIADERYATGDISQEEYIEILENLESPAYTNRLEER